MKRTTKKEYPVLILCADIHLREDTPICRTDNFYETQWKKLDFISELQRKYGCPVIHSGDLYHHWKPSPQLLSDTIQHLPNDFHTVFGNHDLPQHSMELMKKSGVFTLAQAEALKLLPLGNWGDIPEKQPSLIIEPSYGLFRKILVWHIMTYKGKDPWPGCTAPKANKLLKKYPKFDLIVTGDNHKTFIEEYKGRILVNPGSLSRQKADQENHKPSVFLYYGKSHKVKQVFIPIDKNVISQEHLAVQEQKNDRIDAFISKLDTDWTSQLSFEDNLEIFKQKNKIKKEPMQIIYKALES